MEEPTLQENAGIYVLTWPHAHLRIRVDRIKNKHETLSGEISILSEQPASPGLLHQARLNLSSTGARDKLIKVLHGRWDIPDWEQIIELTCLRVIQHLRLGNPVVPYAEMRQREHELYFCQPFLLNRQANLMYGEGGSGKSFFATYLSVLASFGLTDSRTSLTATTGNVLYLDWETDEAEVSERIAGIVMGMDSERTDGGFYYRACDLRLVDDIEAIQRICVEHAIQLVVVDSVGLACGEVMEPSPVIEYFRALRTLHITTLSIDHIRKNHESGKSSAFGSIYKMNLARSVWEIRSLPTQDHDDLIMGLYHKKVNHGTLQHAKGFKISIQEGFTKFFPQDLAEVEQLAAGVDLKFRLRTLLLSGSLSKQELFEKLNPDNEKDGVKLDSIRKALERNDSLFIKMGESWGLKTHESDEVVL